MGLLLLRQLKLHTRAAPPPLSILFLVCVFKSTQQDYFNMPQLF